MPVGAIESNTALSFGGNADLELLSPLAVPISIDPNTDARAEAGSIKIFGERSMQRARSRSPSDCSGKHYTLTIEALCAGEAHSTLLRSGHESPAPETPDTSCLNPEVMEELHSERWETSLDKCASREGKLSSWVHAMDLLLQAKGAAHTNAAAASAVSSLPPSSESDAMIAHNQRAPIRERSSPAGTLFAGSEQD